MDGRTYSEKRAFDQTPEPEGDLGGNADPSSAPAGSAFVIHQHHARRLHFDLRLEMLHRGEPVLVSWAVPRNLPRRKGKPHLAVHVEDHPMEYATFSGTIPAGNYGAGEVRIFDSGTYELLEQAPGKLTFRLRGRRLQGVYHLVRTGKDESKEQWLAFIKSQERPEPEAPPELVPMAATLAEAPFDDDRWLFEFKWDGVRALATCDDATMLVSRNGRDITETYPELARVHEHVVALDAIVDGEIVAFEGERPSFELLQSRINLRNPRTIERIAKEVPVTFIVFDILYLDGRSTTSLPLEERKLILQDMIVPSGSLQVSPCMEGDGTTMFEIARQRRLEGVVAKKIGSVYRPARRTRDWLKIKATTEADVVVGGWTPGEGSRSATFGALLVGAYDGDGLVFLGAVGTGFSERVLADILPRLHDLEAAECPFSVDPRSLPDARFGKAVRNPRWVRPELVARVEFRELTSALRLRAPSFHHLRDDKDAADCLVAHLTPAAPGG